jgi:RES domain-containing protein
VRVWRIGAETRTYKADDLSGGGASLKPGRWNAAGEPVVYAATSIALAVLETAASVDSAGLPLNRFVVAIDVPTKIWEKRREAHASVLPGGWDAVPAGMTSVSVGSKWLSSKSSAVLTVPSVIVPEEDVVLINPLHHDFAKVTAKTSRRFAYNTLFRA